MWQRPSRSRTSRSAGCTLSMTSISSDSRSGTCADGLLSLIGRPMSPGSRFMAFFVGRLQFLLGGLQLFVGALQLFVAGENFLVGRAQLFVGGILLLDERLQILLGGAQLLAEVR